MEAHRAYLWANGLRARLAKHPDHPVAQELSEVCTVYLDMVIAHRDGKPHPEWGPRWLAMRTKAHAALGVTPAGLAVPATVPPSCIESLRDDAADPDARPAPQPRFTEQPGERDPIDDYPDEEGGYRWYRDRPPDPLDR